MLINTLIKNIMIMFNKLFKAFKIKLMDKERLLPFKQLIN